MLSPSQPPKLKAAEAVTSGSLSVLATWVRTHFGISYGPEQEPVFKSRIDVMCRARGITSELLLQSVMRGDHSVVVALAEALSTNHTYFYREPPILEAFADTILPTLANRDKIRIWSAASSSGDEAYSLAILSADRLGAATASQKVAILGTDISQKMIETAESAVYPLNRLQVLPKHLLKGHFVGAGLGNFKVVESTRTLCSFRRLNLTKPPWPFQNKFQVIFLRNVLYYFERAEQEIILRATWDAADEGAWLLTSLTEPLHGVNMPWRPNAAGIYRKVTG